MNKYEIIIEGMHCNACSNLISMELEDAYLQDVNVIFEKKKANFTSEKDLKDIKEIIKTLFENEDIKKYQVISIEQV